MVFAISISPLVLEKDDWNQLNNIAFCVVKIQHYQEFQSQTENRGKILRLFSIEFFFPIKRILIYFVRKRVSVVSQTKIDLQFNKNNLYSDYRAPRYENIKT